MGEAGEGKEEGGEKGERVEEEAMEKGECGGEVATSDRERPLGGEAAEEGEGGGTESWRALGVRDAARNTPPGHPHPRGCTETL